MCDKSTYFCLQPLFSFVFISPQVTRQTKELTRAFERQTQHIAGLLIELQEKESALFSQGEELQRYRQELNVLKSERTEEEKRDTSTETPEQEQECVVTVHTADPCAAVKIQNDTSQTKIETHETPEPEGDSDAVTSEKQQSVSVDLKNSESNRESGREVAKNPCSPNVVLHTELIAVRQENLMLKQKLEVSRISDPRNPTLQTEGKNRDDSVKQSQSSSPLFRFEEEEAESDIITEEQESLQGNVKKNENEGQDSERGEVRSMSSEVDQEEESDVNHLQLQVEEDNHQFLNTKSKK